MKDILIAVTLQTDHDRKVCIQLATAPPEGIKGLQALAVSTFLLTGPTSFETAIKLCNILQRKNLLYVCAEVCSVLVPAPAPTDPDGCASNHQDCP